MIDLRQPGFALWATPRQIFVALRRKFGGANRDRTDDLKLAKLALSQLSYGPVVDRDIIVPGLRCGWLAEPKLRGDKPAFALRASARQPSLRFA